MRWELEQERERKSREIVINAHDIFNYNILMRLWVDGFYYPPR